MNLRSAVIAAMLASVALAGCKTEGDIVINQGVGITALRSVCPAVGIPEYTGDVTFFSPVGGTTVDDIDVTAVMTNVRSQCDDAGDEVYSTATFEVQGVRHDTAGERAVEIPYFSTVMRGGSSVVAKRIGTVTLYFADGQSRASGLGQAGAVIDKSEATLPADIRERITRRRRAGDEDAAIDPLTEPDVRAAVARATFELLVGFQLTDDQLRYNATR